MRSTELQILQGFGIHVPASAEYLENERDLWRDNFAMAMDAQPTLVTVSNAGIPAYLTNLIDPDFIRVLTSPMAAAEIYGEVKKGDWTKLSAQFPVVEATGEVSSYGDFNNNGSTGFNVNWESRQSYHYQTISEWGEREAEMYGEARINYAAEINNAGALVLSKFQNQSYFYGIAGLQNYGALNDPGLLAPIAPNAKTAGGFTWLTATAKEIYEDIQKLFAQLVLQMGGNVKRNARMRLALSNAREVELSKVSDFNVTGLQTIKGNFPNLDIVTAPEFSTDAGELMQLILLDVDGKKTTQVAFTEKMRAHPVIADLSSWKQKKSGGTWGFIGRYPIAIASMIGL